MRVPSYHRLIRAFQGIILDVLIIQIAYTAVFYVRSTTATLNYLESFSFIVLATLTLVAALYLFEVYRRIWDQTSGHGVYVIINAVAVATLIITLADTLLDPQPLPLSVVVFGNMLSLVGFVAVRYRSRLITGASWRWKHWRQVESPKPATRMLIIGAGAAGQELAWRLKHRSPTNTRAYRIVGFIDDDVKKQGLLVEGCPVLGTRADIPRLAETLRIDLLAVAIHNIQSSQLRDILAYCEHTTARIKITPDVFALMNAKQGTTLLRDIQVEDLIGRRLITHNENVDLSQIQDKRILVTGAAGSIGSEVCRQLCMYELGKLIILDNNESGLHELSIELKSRFPSVKIVPILADITIKEAMETVFSKYQPQIVFHAAAYKHVPMLQYFPNEALRVNVGGTRLLAELARDYKVERFVLISTDKAVNPSSIMGASKRACELTMRAFAQQNRHRSLGTLFTSVRFGNVLGSRGSVVPTFNQQIDSGGPLTVTDPEMTRYFMSIAEAANLVIHAVCLTRGGDTFLLRMGETVRIVDLAERMIRLRGLRPYIDIPIQFVGTRPGEKLYEQLHSDSEIMVDTIHPGIIQLQSLSTGFNAGLFLEQLDALLKCGLDPQARDLMDLITEEAAPAEHETAA